ncbi:MAG: DUF1153 domain-containing protein [Thermoanaerobaculia bacterium]|nr:MAG: DUF1153 domain-containing protein [Thermoanaerobaculia bacterium]
MDHQTWREWLDLDVDGALGDEERRRLAGHLAGCSECVAERRRLEALAARLAAGKIALRPDFKASVMAALPPAPWESRSRRAWRLPAVLLAGLAVAEGRLSLDDACSRYALTVDEFVGWQTFIERHGLEGLRTTRLQHYRMRSERV